FGWSISAGSPPPALTLTDNENGTATLSGVPTTGGNYTFTVQTNCDCLGPPTLTQQFSILIIGNLVFTSTSPLPPGMVGVNYSQTLQASGGAPPYTFSADSLPAGLTLNAGGSLFGTPAMPGTSLV